MPKVYDFKGQKIGLLTIIGECGRRRGSILWEAVCDCGEVVNLTTNDITSHSKLSCKKCKKQVRDLDIDFEGFIIRKNDWFFDSLATIESVIHNYNYSIRLITIEESMRLDRTKKINPITYEIIDSNFKIESNGNYYTTDGTETKAALLSLCKVLGEKYEE